MLMNSPWSLMNEAGDVDCINEISGLASMGSDVLGNCFRNDHVDSAGLYQDYPSELCQLEVASIAAGNQLQFFRNEMEDKNCSDIMNFGWLDIGNFEDVDQLFRNSDSTFGQKIGGSMSGSWSASSAANATEPIESLTANKEQTLMNDFNTNSTSNSFSCWPSGIDGSFDCLSDWVDENYQNEAQPAPSDQASTQMQPSCGTASENLEECRSWEFLNGGGNSTYNRSSGHGEVDVQVAPFSSSSLSGRGLWEPALMNEYGSAQLPNLASQHHPTGPHPRKKNGPVYYSTQAVDSLKHSPSNMDENLQNMHWPRLSALTSDPTGYDTQQGQPSQFWNQSNGATEDIVHECDDSSNAQDCSCISSIMDNTSLQASSFQQLQNVVQQLDTRTKLCIRDGLYRLAQSAAQRHLHSDYNESRCDGTNSETNTNPIDRSIAHLLFYDASEPSRNPVSDAVSLESQIIIEGTNVEGHGMSNQRNGTATGSKMACES